MNQTEQNRENRLFIEAKGLKKSFDLTIAVKDVSIRIYKGEVLALVGANGAGKSTLTHLLSGGLVPDRGEIVVDGRPLNIKKNSPAEARKRGVRVVHQELSLCNNLTVYENFYIEHHSNFDKKSYNWRKIARDIAFSALDSVFPGNTIDVNAGLSTLSIAQQQMVEISRALCDPEAKLLILDEPTSSLPNKETQQLQNYIKADVVNGKSYIYISHRLQEIVDLADHVYIMQNGQEKYQCSIEETTIDDMVVRMGEGILNDEKADPTVYTVKKKDDIFVKFSNHSSNMIKDISTSMFGGEIIAVTGLEGNGQLELIKEIFFHEGKKSKNLKINGKVAFVAGDRKKEGIFPLWSIEDNTVISHVSDAPLFRMIKSDDVDKTVNSWNNRLKTKCHSYDELIVHLSGGNQQKVLIARALASNADIILLDDPTKGVDVATKTELYEIFKEVAKNGKLIIWRTSDDTELEYCSRILVMKSGKIAGEVDQKELDHSSILKMSFKNEEKKSFEEKDSKKRKVMFLLPLAIALILYIVSGLITPAVFSKFGFELLAVGLAPFIFAALGQTFIIGLGHIDLSIGAFMGLVNVVCSTILMKNTGFGLLLLFVLLMAYSFVGVFIYWKKMPAIIVTLSMSFIWTGMAYVLQDVPGGQVPQWMISFFNFNSPILQGILVWLFLCIAGSIVFYRSRYGTVLRGFGNNEKAMINSGWSKVKAFWSTYFVAGLLVVMGGISQSAITGASDINASVTYTMLTVAAVIIGGGYFIGGVVTLAGTVFGGIILTMISVLLGLLRISTDFTATIQGLVLILILSARLLKKKVLQ